MIEEAPEPKEVAHYHFNQLRTLKIVKENDSLPKNLLNAIAVASKYGMLFVGMANGFKVLKLENILDLNENTDNKNVKENYWSQAVFTESLVHLSLSCEQKTLAVCVWRNSCVVADMYDIGSFADPNLTPVPFLMVPLSENSCKLNEFVFNPVVDAVYCFCMQDGSLSVHEIAGTTYKVVASLPNAGAVTACWSPKGKQLVVGKQNGSFSQYKPTLQEVKNIPPPNLNEKLIVASICWISTAQFAVLYMPEAKMVSPYLFIVSTPKGLPITYTNFYDVCLGNATSNDQRYFLHHEAAWGILTCSSTDSIEIATLGNPPTWVQFELRDDRRALLPAKLGAKHTLGMGLAYCSQRMIVINETESYPPMPIVFFLTDNGLLVSYHVVNTAADAQSLVHPVSPIEIDRERSKTVANTNFGAPISSPAVNPVNSLAPVVQTPPLQNSSFQVPNVQSPFGHNQTAIIQNNELQPVRAMLGESIYETPPKLTLGSAEHGMSTDSDRFHKPSKGANIAMPSIGGSGTRTVAVAQRLSTGNRIESEKGTPNSHFHGDGGTSPVSEKENAQNQSTYMTALIEEILAFDKEIEDLRKSTVHLNSIGTKEEMTRLKSSTSDFQDFQRTLTDTMVSLNGDIHSLKNGLLESFVMVEEANSRERRKNDHSYISMLRDRALDPMTAKRMQQIDQHYNYVNSQLHEVTNKLDMDWFEFLQKKRDQKKVTRHVSSNEAVYKTVVDNQQIIHTLRKRVDSISKTASDRKNQQLSQRRNKTQFTKSSGPDELSMLADAFLQAKIHSSDEEKPQLSRKMSPEAKNMLKKYLSSSNVTQVRPTVVCSPSQSRLISRSFLFSERIEQNNFSTPVHENVQPIAVQPQLAKGLTIVKPKAIINSKNAGSPPPLAPPIPSIEESKNITTSSKTPVALETQTQPMTTLQNSPDNTVPVKSTSSTITSPVQDDSPAYLTSPVYEDITPPDSPRRSLNLTEESKVIEVSFSQEKPKVQPAKVPTGFKTIPSSVSETKSASQALKPPVHSTASTIASPFPSASLSLSTQSLVAAAVDAKPTTTSASSSMKPFSFLSPPPSMLFQTPSSKETSDLSPQRGLTPIPPTQSDGTKLTFGSGTKTTSSSSTFGFNSAPPNVTAPVSQQSIFSSLLGPPKGTPPSTSTPSLFPFSGTQETSKTKPFSFYPTITDSAVPEKSTSLSATTTSILKPSQNVTPPAKTTAAMPALGGSSFFQNPVPALSKTAFNLTPLQKSVADIPKTVSISTEIKPGTPIAAGDKTTKTAKEAATMPSLFPATSSSSATSLASKSLFGQPAQIVDTVPVSIINVPPIPGITTVKSNQENNVPVTPITVSELPVNTIPSPPGSELTFFKAPSTTVPTPVTPTVLGSPAAVVSSSSEPVKVLATTTSTSTVLSPTTSALLSTAASSSTSTTVSDALSSTVPVFSEASALLFGKTAGSASAFIQPITTTSPTLVQPALTTAPETSSVQTTPAFGQPAATTQSTFFAQPSSFFTQPSTTQAAPSFFTQPATTQASSSFFGGQPAVGQSSFFAKTTAETPSFGTSVDATSGPTPQTSGSFFSQSSVFGSNPANSNTAFGGQGSASGFSFGKSAFGQTQGSFGLAKSVFGQTSGFGQPASQPAASTFGQTDPSSVFGQGSFFSGLGGKPSAEDGNKNVFAAGTFGKPNNESSSFGSFTGTGGFSSGGSVAQSGFGAFQQTPQKTGGFGAAPSFGSSASFGSPPTFGSGSPLGAVFGAAQTAQNSNFSSFASASSPTFGTLASQSPGSFGNPQQQQSAFGQQSPSAFGSEPVFGATPGFGSPSLGFGGGGASSPSSNTSAFTQWRN